MTRLVIQLPRELFPALIFQLRLGRSPALDDHQGWSERSLNGELVLGTLGGFGQVLEEV